MNFYSIKYVIIIIIIIINTVVVGGNLVKNVLIKNKFAMCSIRPTKPQNKIDFML
jgi:hypothetical protein